MAFIGADKGLPAGKRLFFVPRGRKMNKKTVGLFTGCRSCRKHCCLFKREESNMCLYISGKESEQIEAITGKTGNITSLPDGRIVIKWNEEGYCPFVNKQGCTLGELRPLPCKFYPYGIMLKDNIYYLIRWTNICESFMDNNDQDEYDSLYELIYPGLEKRAFPYSEHDEGSFVIVQEVPKKFLRDHTGQKNIIF